MADKKLIYIADDEVNICSIIKSFLNKEGYDAETFHDGRSILDAFNNKPPDLMVIDIMMPEIDGFSLCSMIRQQSSIPIIIVSAKDTETDKIAGLSLGSDDYLTKPFSQIELVARVKSHLRRATNFLPTNSAKNMKKIFGRLCINSASYEVVVDGKRIDFSPKEFQLLDFLSDNSKQVFTKEQLIDQVWGYTEFIDENTIAVYIGRIREKLAREHVEFIKTVWGVGYRWES